MPNADATLASVKIVMLCPASSLFICRREIPSFSAHSSCVISPS